MDAIQKIINEGRPADIICISDSREARYKVRTWYKIGVHDGYNYAIKVKRKQMIEKAIKWIEYYNNNGGCLFDGWKDDFVKAIEK